MPPKKQRTPTKGRVLVIEDNFFMAQLLVERMVDQGLEAIHASNQNEALAEIKKVSFQAIIIDLPAEKDRGRFDYLEEIRRASSTTPIIFLLDRPDPKQEQEALSRGASKVLIKEGTTSTKIVDILIGFATGKDPEKVPPSTPEEIPARDKHKEELAKNPGIKDPLQENQGKPERLGEIKAHIEDLLSQDPDQVSIISLVDNLMGYAFLTRASDIHLEPVESSVIARLRIDGILRDEFEFPKTLQPGIISRIKVLGAMRTDEHQTAQDGRFRITMKEPEQQFDVRVSIVPTFFGENAVLRLLAEQTQINSLDDVALSDADRKKIRNAIKTPYGMILATGPTGSGKTTTLYTILKELSTREVSIITIEDPVEYSIAGIDQIQVNSRSGLTFANGLRSILRQDPNIIMVGEIRDEETASIAVNAALTGHKLLSTLHTNDAATTLPRLLDMGVEPFLVASTVNIALGQRLVRMLCQNCKTTRRITSGEFQALQESIPLEVLDDHRDFFEGKGCAVCGNSGYRGRMGIYEVLEINDFIREAIMRRVDAGEIKKIAIKNGMTTLLEDGFKKALAGWTTIEEVLRVTHE